MVVGGEEDLDEKHFCCTLADGHKKQQFNAIQSNCLAINDTFVELKM